MMNKLSTFIISLLAFTVQQTYAGLVTYDFTGNYSFLDIKSNIRNDIRDEPFPGRKFNGYVTFDNADEGYTGCCDNTTSQYINSSNILHINFETTSGSYAQFQMDVSNIVVVNDNQAYGFTYDAISINTWAAVDLRYQPVIDEIGYFNWNYFIGMDLGNYENHELYSDTKLSNKKLHVSDYTFATLTLVGSKYPFNGSEGLGWLDEDFVIAGNILTLHERLPTPVDIPATAPLFFTGLLMILWRRTRKNS